MRVRIPPEAWMSVSYEHCVLSGEVSATRWSLVQRSPAEGGVSAWPWSLANDEVLEHWGLLHQGKKKKHGRKTSICNYPTEPVIFIYVFRRAADPVPVDCFQWGHIKNMTYQQKERHRNNETHSRNHCCRAKAIRISNSECVFVALNIQNSKRIALFHHLWHVWLHHIFPQYLIKDTNF